MVVGIFGCVYSSFNRVGNLARSLAHTWTKCETESILWNYRYHVKYQKQCDPEEIIILF